ncbi:MAG: DUF3833 domain-containing protein [Luminiphilus sp.]|nr:DUF3833 domain-containing protein [Luminiphilus sp.]MDG2136589.1 DUF3833 domain-containing protein [Luminiphilus sp.]MDG2494563.1 DUF3833 domain-containing protein [Luminiphilus sp.]
MSCDSFRPSSPRWFFLPGPRGRGFFSTLSFWRGLSCGASLLLLVGCGSAQLQDHEIMSPELQPEDFFSGFLTAHGVVRDRRGGAIRQFNADISACWSDGVGILDEDFVFDDGEKQKRVWTLTPGSNQTFIATAGDVVGDGVGRWSGSAFVLDYTLRIQLEDSTVDVRVDDRMYRISEHVVVNQSQMTKFGVDVGEILLTIIRHPETEVQCAPD